MADFPDELIDDIRLRFPVKSLLRFRCVSKTWCALIDNNTFVRQHLNRSILTKNSKFTLIFDNNSDVIYSLGHNPLINQAPLTNQALELAQPIINPKAASAKVMILGSCNGLICLFYESLNDLIVIWNPATRKHVKLPHIDTIKSAFYITNPTLGNLSSGCIVVHGFGYDSVSDDYKVVILVQFFLGEDGNILVSQSYVYSLRSDSWRIIDVFLDCVMDDPQRPDVLVRNAIHWTGTKLDFTPFVVAFDFTIDNYRLVTLPQYHVDDQVMRCLVSELDGCLSILFCHYMIDVFDVWVMKDYGVTESWTKLFTISSSDTILPIQHLIPLAYSEIGDEVLLMLNWEMLVWYNLKMKTVKFVNIRGHFNPVHPVICLESLVCLGLKAEHDERLVSENAGPKEEHQEESSGSTSLRTFHSLPSLCLQLFGH